MTSHISIRLGGQRLYSTSIPHLLPLVIGEGKELRKFATGVK